MSLFLNRIEKWNTININEIVSYVVVVSAINVSIRAPNRKIRSKIENDIVEKYKVTLTKKDYHKLLAIPGIELIAVEKEHSIRLYFLCSTLEALQTLRRLLESGQLKEFIEKLFNSLLTDDIQFKPVHLTHLSLVNYCSSMDYFNNGGNNVTCWSSCLNFVINMYAFENFRKSSYRQFSFIIFTFYDFTVSLNDGFELVCISLSVSYVTLNK